MLEAKLGCCATRIDADDSQTLVASALDVGRRRDRQTQRVELAASVIGVGAGFARLLVRELAELQIDRLLLAVTDNAQNHCFVRSQRRDLAREIARVLDLNGIDAGYDVAGFQPGLCSRATSLRIRDERTCRSLQTEALGDFPCHRLDLNSKPAARDLATLLEAAGSQLATVEAGISNAMPTEPPDGE